MKIVKFENGECKRVRSYLDSYLSNELMVETNLEVLKHLENCADCSRELDDRERIKTQLKRAVLNVQAPAALQDRIRSDIRRPRRLNFNLTQSWILAAAAVIVLAVGLGIFFRPGGGSGGSNAKPLSVIAEVAPNDVAGQILKVGFDDHVFCAIDHGMASKHFSSEEMSEKLGPKYQGLVELVKEKMPQGFEIVVGHRCHYKTREFIHVIARRQGEVVSLILTQKIGEAFPAESVSAVMNAAGVPVHEASWSDIQVAGLETSNYLVFVISNETRKENEQIASSLMPSVSDFLRRIEV
ncbi:MAG TPA: zf-HC2 domain-containing protein [Blastocatellia bacterium]|nr:zf-HC2 domain-containing protein [Blastocatellia bacterium]